jgi:polygalacturonase
MRGDLKMRSHSRDFRVHIPAAPIDQLPLIDRRGLSLALGGALLASPALAKGVQDPASQHDIRRYGAKGDGKAIDSIAINRAIDAANRAGGGLVIVPPGRYLSFSIRLKDHVTLLLANGSIIEAADPATHGGSYDAPENYLEEQFQDFGITHVHNSLIYADGASDFAIIGRGMLYGKGLDRADGGDAWHGKPGWKSPSELGLTPREARLRDPIEQRLVGRGNKAIGLRECRNVLLRDFTILQGGHFGVIAHGVTNMTIDNLTIDTDRDGIDVDCCRDVRVTNCIVNAPKDDAIVLKSSYALNRKVLCEDVTVSGCKTSGYLMGSLLDGTYRKSDYGSTDGRGALGRIKLGTESNGGFRNILITDCMCQSSRGILVGIVDGGILEDVVVSDITLRDPFNHPLFVHLSARHRAPKGVEVGKCRRVRFDNINVSGADWRFPCGVAGLPGAPVEDVSFSNIHVSGSGGGTAEDATRIPPERPEASLEVSFMGTLPAYGFYARHAQRLMIRDVEFTIDKPDARPAVMLDDVHQSLIGNVVCASAPETAVATRASSDIRIGKIERFG